MSSVSPQLGKTVAETYKHSGRVPPAGLVLALLILIPSAIILGILYSGGVVFVPFIKLRGLLTCLYGGALGGLVGIICRTTKFRSNLAVGLMTLLVIAVSYYASWALHAAFVVWRFEGWSEDVSAAAISGWLPQNIYAWAAYIHEEGLWAMGKNGGAMSGIGVCILWLVEFLVIAGVAWVAKSTYGTSPFCEDCNRWTDETKELAHLPVSPSDPAWERFADGDLDAVKRLQVVQNVPHYVELQLAACPGCQNSDFVSAVGVMLAAGKDGEIQKNETDIVRHLRISRSQRDEITDFAGMLAEAVAEMDQEIDEELGDHPDGDQT